MHGTQEQFSDQGRKPCNTLNLVELDSQRINEGVIQRIYAQRAANNSAKYAVPTPEDLLADPTVPFWAQVVIKSALQKDPIDAANILETIAKSFARRADALLAEAGTNV